MTKETKALFGLFFALALVFSTSCGQAETGPDLSEINRALQTAVESGDVPGVVAAAASGSEVLHLGAFGLKNLESGEPLPTDSIFRIASMTKAVTSVAVMQLVERGEVRLEDPIQTHLPEFAEPKVLEGFDDEGQPRLRSATRSPTVRELLTHTAGYAYSFSNESIDRYEKVVSLPSGRDSYRRLPLVFDPGSQWEYGPSTVILGILVESVSGLTLEDYFQRHIFEPLGMRDTRFQVSAGDWSRVVPTYQREADGGFGPAVLPLPAAPPQVTFFRGDGGLYSTAPDYIRFLRALLNGGRLDDARLLNAETVDMMARNHIGDHEAGILTSNRTDWSRDVNFFPDSKDGFGLGFLINTEPVDRGRAAGSLAWAGMINTCFWVDPNSDICGVVMTQILPFGNPPVLTLLEEYEKTVYSAFRNGQ